MGTGTGSTAATSAMLRKGLDPNKSNEMPSDANKYHEMTWKKDADVLK